MRPDRNEIARLRDGLLLDFGDDAPARYDTYRRKMNELWINAVETRFLGFSPDLMNRAIVGTMKDAKSFMGEKVSVFEIWQDAGPDEIPVRCDILELAKSRVWMIGHSLMLRGYIPFIEGRDTSWVAGISSCLAVQDHRSFNHVLKTLVVVMDAARPFVPFPAVNGYFDFDVIDNLLRKRRKINNYSALHDATGMVFNEAATHDAATIKRLERSTSDMLAKHAAIFSNPPIYTAYIKRGISGT